MGRARSSGRASSSDFLLSRWRDSSRRTSLENERKEMLDKAKLEAEAMKRDARLAANEEALKVRTEIEQVGAARQKELAVIEQRLITREELVNRQLENLVKEEKVSPRRPRGAGGQVRRRWRHNANWPTNWSRSAGRNWPACPN